MATIGASLAPLRAPKKQKQEPGKEEEYPDKDECPACSFALMCSAEECRAQKGEKHHGY